MKKLFTTILAVAMFAVAALAEDVVYLNNGTVIKGTVTKDDGTTVEVQTKSGSLTYKKLEVRKIDKGSSVVVVPETPKRAKYIDYETQDRGWWCAVEVMGGGSVDISYNPHFYNIGFSFINGYRINQWFRVGVGVGFRYYITTDKSIYQEDKWLASYGIKEPKAVYGKGEYPPEYNGKTVNGSPWSIPLFLDLRGNLVTNDTRQCVPYWALDLGYSFGGKFLYGLEADPQPSRMGPNGHSFEYDNVNQALGDGFFFAPTLGIKIGTPRNTLLIGLTYMGQIMPRYDLKNLGTAELPQYQASIVSRYTSFMCGKIAYEF